MSPTSDRPDAIPQGELALRVARCADAASASGALRPIVTEEAAIDDGDVRFVVRRMSRAAKPQPAAPRPATAPRNPFLPPEPELTVGELSATHLGVLNKYPVVPRHLLMVTKAFVPQETLLDRADFDVLARCLREWDGLGFYNGGRDAGASQPHKHLQFVPLPLGASEALGPWAVPTEALFDTWSTTGNVNRLLRLGFRNGFAPLEPALFDDPAAGERLHALYAAMLEPLGLREAAHDADGYGAAANDELETPPDGPERQAAPYNLLATRRWLLVVPRSKERFDSIQVNALGYAGSLFVRDDAELRRVADAGPMAVLRAVACV